MSLVVHDEERAAWLLAEMLIAKARAMMRQAEQDMDAFVAGKELMRRRCERRGISDSDAEIRWNETANAQRALADNSFHAAQATMYYGAAAAHYARAAYLRSRAQPHPRLRA